MIKLKFVEMRHGETTLVFEADGFPEGTREVEIPLSEIVEKLKTVKQILGQPVTIKDAKNVIKTIIEKVSVENNYSIVLDASAGSILYAKPNLDITDSILDEMEKAVE